MKDIRVMGRWPLAALASAAFVALGVSHVSAQIGLPKGLAQAPTVALESQAGTNPSVSADGRFVVFAGPPATEGDERGSTVWLRDRSNGGEVELTQARARRQSGRQHLAGHQRRRLLCSGAHTDAVRPVPR